MAFKIDDLPAPVAKDWKFVKRQHEEQGNYLPPHTAIKVVGAPWLWRLKEPGAELGSRLSREKNVPLKFSQPNILTKFASQLEPF